jgi:formylglycine-generating enzyme required for sulfatase activity/uncharacterized caspase-like protein
MSAKYALIIGNTEYSDSGLAQLTAPGKDAEDFARVLKNQDICAFDDVKVLLNQPEHIVRRGIDVFFDQKKPDDLLLLYFSGHGVRDELGALYLAVKNTMRTRLRSTAIKSDYIRETMDQSRSRRQVLILDCCNSGAFAQGTKAATGVSIGTASAFEAGYGSIILTASDSIQYAWEGDRLIGETQNSLFTHFLVKGLEGEADLDGDGHITVDELYDYAYDQVRLTTPKQTPSKFSSKQQGEIFLRQNLRIEDIKPVALPADLIEEIEDTRPYVRGAAVQKLERLLRGKNIGLARSAREALVKIVADENTTRHVAEAATQALESIQQVEQNTGKAGEELVTQGAANIERTKQEEAKKTTRESANLIQATKELEPIERQVQSSPAPKVVIGKKVQPGKSYGRFAKWVVPFLGGMAVVLIIGGIAWRVVGQSFFTPRQTEIPTNAIPAVTDLENTNAPSIIATEANFALTNTSAPSPIIEAGPQQSTSTVADTSTALTSTPSVPASKTPSASGLPNPRDQQVNPNDGVTLIFIPAGEFTFGLTAEQVAQVQSLCGTQKCKDLIQKSNPAHKTKITKGYWIYRTEVSNANYTACLRAGVCTELKDDGISFTKSNYFQPDQFANYPVVWVEWAQAKTYCEWAGGGGRGRLPTSAEWEYAGRGADGILFPWGNATPTANHANVNSFYNELRPVSDFADFPSPFGVLNLAGNVWEWVSDYYDSTYYATNTDWVDPKGPDFPDEIDDRVIRGGSAWFSSAYASVGVQDSEDPVFIEGLSYYGVGFRCVVDEP